MHLSRPLSLLAAATLVGTSLTAATTTAAGAATAADLPTAVSAPSAADLATATTGCAAKAVAAKDATTYSSLRPKALVGIASYNIRGQHSGGWTNWPGRRDAIAAQVANCQPDVIGVQEAAESWVWETNSSSSARRISQYENFTDEVNERTAYSGNTYVPTNRYRRSCSTTPEWNGTWQGRTAAWRRCLDGEAKGSSDNRIIYNSTTVKLLSQGFGNLSSATSTRRTVAWAVLEQRATQRRFFVATTHLDAGVSDAYRVTQMKQALAVVSKYRVYGGATLPTFVMGDLNSSRYTEARTAADVLTAASWVDIVGNDRSLRSSGSAGWCRRLAQKPPSVPWQKDAVNTRPQDRFVNSVYNTSNNSKVNCTYPENSTSKPRLDPSLWWKYNGSAIDYIFVSSAVRARTWETVVPPTSSYGVARNTPSDHNMIMTWAFV
jgi:endonuclease/exonuclease/phosphatase family metal-dependent hydrolase